MPITAAPGRPVMAKRRCGDPSPRNLSDLFCAHEAHDRFPHEQGRGVLRERKSYRDGQGGPRTCRRKLSECWTHGRESAKDRGRETVVEGLSATSANRIVSAGTGSGSREARKDMRAKNKHAPVRHPRPTWLARTSSRTCISDSSTSPSSGGWEVRSGSAIMHVGVIQSPVR